MEEYIGNKLFDRIKTDARVNPNLTHCLYCYVITVDTSENENSVAKRLDYLITLNCINGDMFKQCPACKRIYILGDPV